MRTWTKINYKAFLALVRAGLWEEDVLLSSFGDIDYKEVYRVAEEQSVVGLVAAGLEHVKDVKPPKDDILAFVGTALQIEQRNLSMNECVAWLIQKFKEEEIYALLVKGQGVAQCYERPFWRTAGDIDLLLDVSNYEKAKMILIPIAEHCDEENKAALHQAMSIRGIEVELHGRMPFEISHQGDMVVETVLKDTLSGIRINRKCVLNEVEIPLPNVNDDIIIVFTHFLLHFFVEGVGLRQICDWCRLLWTYKDTVDIELLGKRLYEAGLMSEWRVFAAIAVETLGIPTEAMPFYKKGYERRASLTLKRVFKSGNFGHNNDLSYRVKYSGLKYKMVSLWRRFWDFMGMACIFPIDAPKFFITYVFNKTK